MTGRCAQPQALDRRAHKTKSNAGVFRQTTPAAPRQGFAAGLPGPGLQFRMFAQHALEPIKRDSSAKAVHLMHTDVGCEPAENSRQLVVGAAVKRCVVQVPGRYLGPKRILDLVQNVEDPNADGCRSLAWCLSKTTNRRASIRPAAPGVARRTDKQGRCRT